MTMRTKQLLRGTALPPYCIYISDISCGTCLLCYSGVLAAVQVVLAASVLELLRAMRWVYPMLPVFVWYAAILRLTTIKRLCR